MAGRNATEAVRNYREPLKEAVACVTDPHLLVSRRSGYNINEEYSIALLGGDSAWLPSEARIYISLIQYFRIVRDKREGFGPIRVSTTAYYYTIENEEQREILAYHWHPNASNSRTTWPHVHIQHGADVGRPELAGTHVPTGRVSLESFLRMIIEVFEVPAKHSAWERILKRTEGRFDFARNW